MSKVIIMDLAGGDNADWLTYRPGRLERLYAEALEQPPSPAREQQLATIADAMRARTERQQQTAKGKI